MVDRQPTHLGQGMMTSSAIVSLAMDDGREVGNGEDDVIGAESWIWRFSRS